MNGMTHPPASAKALEDWHLGPDAPQSHRGWLRALGRTLLKGGLPVARRLERRGIWAAYLTSPDMLWS